MFRRRAITSALAALALFLGSCMSCPDCPQLPMPSGTFLTTDVNAFGNSAFPWGLENKTIEVDTTQRAVRLRYFHDGHNVEVTWRMSSLSECR